MADVYLALGSNVGDGQAAFDAALTLLAEHVNPIRQAPRYVSKAVGYTDQPDFLNTVISGRTNLSPHELLKFVKHIEQRIGRIERFRWGPREIDIDIIFYNNLVLNEPDLTIPHPRFAQRDFVLRPLLDLDKNLIDPRTKRPVATMYGDMDPTSQAITGQL